MRKIKQAQIDGVFCLELWLLEFGTYLDFGACDLEFSQLPPLAA
jgi:hypothetical protein